MILFVYKKLHLSNLFGLVVNTTTEVLFPFVSTHEAYIHLHFESQSSYTFFGFIHFCLDIEDFLLHFLFYGMILPHII